MPFIRSKNIKGHAYYYLCESMWVDGKPRQKIIAYLGKFSTVDAALAHWREQLKAGQDSDVCEYAREMVKKLSPYV
jgi:hypothetical protein